LHNHVALGKENKQVIGGHLIEGNVKITAEIVLLKSNIDLSRKPNKDTGLMDLNLE
jgi:predicted DNA-binding protein with PD1-like motif